MGKDSNIEWCHHTHNSWWGCVKVSPGCQNCYAETLCERFGEGKIWGPAKTTTRRKFGDKYWNNPLRWNRAAAKVGERHRVFTASMSDVFEDHPDVWDERARLWRLIKETTCLDWLILTKRPENIRRMLPEDWTGDNLPRNIWFGTSAENQEYADLRIPILLEQVPSAAVHFVSYEPALGPVNLTRWLEPSNRVFKPGKGDLNWVIAGAESGPGARPMSEDWVRSVRDQCADVDVTFLYKQKVVNGIKIGSPPLDGVVHLNFPEPRA